MEWMGQKVEASVENHEWSLGSIDALDFSDAPAVAGPGNSPAFGFIISPCELLPQRWLTPNHRF